MLLLKFATKEPFFSDCISGDVFDVYDVGMSSIN